MSPVNCSLPVTGRFLAGLYDLGGAKPLEKSLSLNLEENSVLGNVEVIIIHMTPHCLSMPRIPHSSNPPFLTCYKHDL